MLRRSASCLMVGKAPVTPGPTLYGWGRTVQKRRLEYETVESKYGKKQFNKNWDVAGLEQRFTDYAEMRTYLSFGRRQGIWLYNWGQICIIALLPAAVFHAGHKAVEKYDAHLRRAAWW